MLRNEQRSLDYLERLLQQSLGREITAREKFYLALAQACAAQDRSYEPQKADPQASAPETIS